MLNKRSNCNVNRRRVSSQILSSYILLFSLVVCLYLQFNAFLSLAPFPDPMWRHQITLLASYPFASLPLVQSVYDTGNADDEKGSCQPSQSWQTQTFLSCNNMHEAMASFETSSTYINCGGSRCAFRLLDNFGGDYVVLKTIVYSSKFDQEPYGKARLDSLVMERLTSSHYVANVHGSCGTSQLVEHAEANLHDLFKLRRKHNAELTTMQQLKIAIQLSSAVADLHSFDGALPTIAHMDLCCHQFILIQGVYKLNDFHLSTFIQHDGSKNDTICPYQPTFAEHLVKLHAPEEQQLPNGSWPAIYNAPAVDVYMLGNIMYTLLTNKWIFEGVSNSKATELLQSGARPPLMTTSNDAIVNAMQQAILKCWRNVQDRPTAIEISNDLKDQLSTLQGGKMSTASVKVVIPPLPKGHRYTDSDFNSNLVV